MGFLSKIFKTKPKREAAKIERLPTGSFTVDSKSRILTSTLPQSFPESVIKEIADAILRSFEDARAAGLPASELQFHFGGLKITAREQRSGAMIFLAPIR
jgi:hypothetical protein